MFSEFSAEMSSWRLMLLVSGGGWCWAQSGVAAAGDALIWMVHQGVLMEVWLLPMVWWWNPKFLEVVDAEPEVESQLLMTCLFGHPSGLHDKMTLTDGYGGERAVWSVDDEEVMEAIWCLIWSSLVMCGACCCSRTSTTRGCICGSAAGGTWWFLVGALLVCLPGDVVLKLERPPNGLPLEVGHGLVRCWRCDGDLHDSGPCLVWPAQVWIWDPMCAPARLW